MSFQTSLVKNTETGKICLCVSHHNNSAIHELPDAMATWDEKQLREYFDEVVKEVTPQLLKMSANDRKKMNRKKVDLCAITTIDV